MNKELSAKNQNFNSSQPLDSIEKILL